MVLILKFSPFPLQLWQVSLVLQVSLVPRDLLALLDPQVKVLKVCLDPKDLLELLVLLVAPFLENPDPLVDLANLETTEHLVRGVTLDPLELRDLGEPLVPLEALDLPASLPVASLDLLVFLELWDQEESLV